jgi:hypothetical protein
MKKPLTASEMGKRGGKARAAKLSKARLHEIALNAGRAAGRAHTARKAKRLSSPQNDQ